MTHCLIILSNELGYSIKSRELDRRYGIKVKVDIDFTDSLLGRQYKGPASITWLSNKLQRDVIRGVVSASQLDKCLHWHKSLLTVSLDCAVIYLCNFHLTGIVLCGRLDYLQVSNRRPDNYLRFCDRYCSCEVLSNLPRQAATCIGLVCLKAVLLSDDCHK